MSSVTVLDGFQHLPFGQPRPSPWGLIDGIFVASAAHPGSADLSDVIQLELLFNQKADWVYIVQSVQLHRQQQLGSPWFASISIISAPSIPGTFLTTQIRSVSGTWTRTTSLTAPSVGFPDGNIGPWLPFKDMVLWGDQNIAGNYLVARCDINKFDTTNIDYSFQMTGWIVKTQTFFRGVVPRLA